MKDPKFRLIVTALSVVLAGCMTTGADSGPQQDDQPQDGEVHFLRQRPSDAPNMLAPYEGELVLSEACLRIQNDDGGTGYTAIWPYEFSLNTQGDSVQILNGDKEVVAQVGDQISVSGGEIPQLSPDEFEDNFIGSATQCASPYWIVNSDVEVITQ